MSLFLTLTKSTADTAVLHLHLFAQVGSAIQPHLISYLQPTTAAGRVVQTGRHPVSSLVHL